MHYIAKALELALQEFRRKMMMGKKKEAILALCEFNQHYSGCQDKELLTVLREFVVLNPYHHLPGNVEAVNLLQQLDADFRKDGMAALQEQIATLTQAAQAPVTFDQGFNVDR